MPGNRHSSSINTVAVVATTLSVLAVGAAPRVVQAQQVGTVTGRVLDRDTRQPLVAAAVQVVGTTRGGATDENGVYRIPGVPAGPVTLRVRRIGYSSADIQVTVGAGATVSQDFALGRAAAQLEQVVISGTGVEQRRREVGASTSSIDTASFNPANVRNLGQVLAARTPGVIVQAPGGTAGTGARIRLRGVSSLSLGNDPLLIVDGVIANNSTSNLTIGVGGQQTSRIEDINPEEIENIEVIKGPAATALFGTGAANGVIQITTKRGRAGRPQWSVWGETGAERTPVEFNDPIQTINYRQIGRNATGARAGACSIEQQALRNCTVSATDTLYTNSPFANLSPFRTGGNGTLGASVSGGSTDVQYFLSGEHDRIRGITQPNFLNRTNLRSNVTANVLKSLNTNVSLGYIRSINGLPINDNAFAGFMSAGLLGIAFDCNGEAVRAVAECRARSDSTSRGYVSTNVPATQYFAQRQQQDIGRLIIGSTSNWTPTGWLRGTVRAGADLIDRYSQTLTPPNQVFLSPATIEGARFQERSYIPNYNIQASLTGSFNPLSWLRSNTTVGTQYLDERTSLTSAFGAVLLPGVESLNGTNARFAVNESNTRVRTVAGYVEQRFEARDRLFFTLGLRADDASVFGNEFGLVYYPAANFSWVLSEEDFFPKPEFLGSFRLRGAVGRSGQRPGFRQAFTTFSPVAVNVGSSDASVGAAAFNTAGNPGLKPEITTEYEGGFESTYFGERVRLDLTGYSRDTRDLLVARNLAPSLGVSGQQFVNLSQMTTRGLEAALSATLLQRTNFSFEQTVNFTTFRNEIQALGEGISPILFNPQQHRAGYPAGSYFARKILSYGDLNGDGLISRVNCPSYGGVSNPQQTGGARCEVVLSDSLEFIGTPLPTREMSFLSNVTLFKNVNVSALVNYRGGQKLYNQTREFRNNGGFANGPDFWNRNAPLSDQVKSVARGMGSSAGYIENADFVRLSELSVGLGIPDRLVRSLRVSGLRLTLAGRNLGVWTDYTGFDPELNSNNGANFTTLDFLTNPPTRRFTARITANF
jgi:TonB-linked SusC/RagA family outer membrane protein